jgi:chromosome partitioning protein
MSVVCIVNRKGGVGKTTLTLALADFLTAIRGYRVLVVDLDPQSNASLLLLGEERWYRSDQAQATVADLFEQVRRDGDVAPGQGLRLVQGKIARVKAALQTISVIPCSPRLQEIEEAMMEGDPAWRYVIGSPYLILHRALAKEVFPAFDYVLLDCPPALGLATLNGLSAAKGFLVPTIPDHVSTIGVSQLVGRIATHSQSLRRPIRQYGTVVNRFKQGTRLHETVLADIRSKPEFQPVWDTIIPDTVKSEEAVISDTNLPTLKGRYGGQSHNYYTAIGRLTEELIRRIS